MPEPEMQQLETAARGGDARARIELGNRLLAANRYDTPEFERGLALLTAAAEENGEVEACWYLGALYLGVSALPDAHANAAKWLARAAERGVATAVDRLADLHLQGLGVAHDPDRAVALQRGLAEQGFQSAAWYLGYLQTQALGGGDAAAAASAFARACALGHPEGYYSLGLRFALGAGVDADPAFARALLIRAADGGVHDARAAADELVPRGEYGREAKRWYDRLKPNLQAAQPMLQRLAASGDAAATEVHPLVLDLERHFSDVGHPALTLDAERRLRARAGGETDLCARPAPWDWRATRPRVGVSLPFATREECAHLIQMIKPHISDPKSYTRGNAYGDLTYFSGEGCPVGPMIADPVIRLLERRIARMSDHPLTALEPCSIVHYRHAQEYRPHTDFFTAEQLEINRAQYADRGGQRLATFLLYLEPPASGGETRYEVPDLTVRGETGLGILHYNVTDDGAPDEASTHVGMPVEAGEKWLWRSALRERALVPQTTSD